MTTTTKPYGLTTMQRAEDLSHLLADLTPAEVLHMVTSAGLDALKRSADSQGKLTLPLEFHISPTDMLPVYLPAGLVSKLDDMGACLGINDGAAAYTREIISDAMKQAPEIMLSLWDGASPEAAEALRRAHRGETTIGAGAE